MIFVSDDYELDLECRELRHQGTAAHVEPQVFDVLVHLTRNRHRVVGTDELIQTVWKGRCVSNATLTSRINAARRAIGDSGKQQRSIRTVPRRGFRFVGEVREGTSDLGIVGARSQSPAAPGPAADRPQGQEIKFCRTSDGVHLAVATAGKGRALVKTANWLNHLEFDWQSPVWSPLFAELAARYRLIRYDERGTGLSSRDVANFSFEAFVHDLECIVEMLGLDRFALFGVSQGAPASYCAAASRWDGASVAVPRTWPGRRRRSPLFGKVGGMTTRLPVKCSRR
jgi:DNA-binding winged helix-turn-helix (wHTH) protein